MEWDLIQKMRQGFLDSDGHLPNYWHDERWLSAYDQTLAQRIAWKWQAVLEFLRGPLQDLRGIRKVVDWGCGTGIASRSFLALGHMPDAHVSLYDRSTAAMQFAARQLQSQFPGQRIELLRKFTRPAEPFVLLVSHVLSELDEKAFAELQELAGSAALLLWVEPGRKIESRRLSQVRDGLRERSRILGPCRHAAACGALEANRENDWCHFFAPVPQEVHHSAFWREFSKRMKVDLRSLPVSWLAALQPEFSVTRAVPEQDALILGRPRVYKGYCRWLACTRSGLCSGDLQKKQDGASFRQLADPEFMTVLAQDKLIRMDDASL